ncbi:MAG: hypothetical protein KC464_34605, partial [Myxococcales bacterium]|nr:hypothetical protein [Myxococcales bacterium]
PRRLLPVLAATTAIPLALPACGASDPGAGPDAAPDATAALPYEPCPVPAPPGDVTGSPDYCVVDAAVFTGPGRDPLADQLATTAAFLLPQHAWDDFAHLYVPRVRHEPPYTGELSAALTAMGFVATDHLGAAETVAPSAIYVVADIIPRDGAPITTTENFEAGPAITQGLHADLLIVRHDDDGTTTAVANASVEVPPVGGALSHAPLIFLERPDVAMPGTYAIVVQAWREATDATPASSWTISLPLAITE